MSHSPAYTRRSTICSQLLIQPKYVIIVSGFSFGIGLTYPLAGFLIAHCGWQVVFYTTGSLGAFWCVFWYFLAFDTPQKHPRISKRELEYIKANIGTTVQGGQVRTHLFQDIFYFIWLLKVRDIVHTLKTYILLP